MLFAEAMKLSTRLTLLPSIKYFMIILPGIHRVKVQLEVTGRESKLCLPSSDGYGGETNGTFKAILKTVAVCDDGRVVGIHHNTGERNGKKLEVDCCIVFEFRDGQILGGKEFFFDLNAWDEFWS